MIFRDISLGLIVNYNHKRYLTGVDMEQYETIQFLGKGSYGQVFEVEHKVSLQRFAMKLLEKQKVKLRSL